MKQLHNTNNLLGPLSPLTFTTLFRFDFKLELGVRMKRNDCNLLVANKNVNVNHVNITANYSLKALATVHQRLPEQLISHNLIDKL